MLDNWTIEDIFQACILCSFWICGRLKIDYDNSKCAISISQEYADLDVIDYAEESDEEELSQAKSQFVETNSQSFTENSKLAKNFSEAEVV